MSHPSHHTTSWDDFRIVKAIAEAQSLTGAAEKLGLNHSTVFRRLGHLEEALGTRLFERARNGYTLTPPGAEMVALASRMSEEIDAFERRSVGRDDKPSGDLTVTVTDTMLHYILMPIFARFAKLFPEIRLDVIVSPLALNLTRRDADVAIRATSDPPETLVGRRLGEMAWARYIPDDPAFVVDDQTRWVGYSDNMAHTLPARLVERESGGSRIFFRLNTMLGQAQAIAAGLGIGIIPCFVGDATPGIRRWGDTIPNPGGHVWILTHPDLRHAARVRAFMDFASEQLRAVRQIRTPHSEKVEF